MSWTGNTKKVAEAIFDVIPQPKEIKRVDDVTSLGGYDLAFLGFPMHMFGPDEKVKTFLGAHARDRTIALFITHSAPDGYQPVQVGIQKFRYAAVGANIVSTFHCQGQLSQQVKTNMLNSPNPPLHRFVQVDSSQGQPDETRLERARTFANETVNKLKP